ncbi:MAG: hypothetical protein ACXAC7_00520 [Candidatus Hodarchaeales archaeon]|jgi:hypothetical protein
MFHYNENKSNQECKLTNFSLLEAEQSLKPAIAVKHSLLNDTTLINRIKDLFQHNDTIFLDYEGDDKLLTNQELLVLCNWVENTFSQKKLVYTVAVRSEKYDAMTRDGQLNIKRLISLHQVFKSFFICLVPGHPLYLNHSAQKKVLDKRFNFWINKIIELSGHYKPVFLGADKMLRLAKRLMLKYTFIFGILLKSPNIKAEISLFDANLKERLGIYALKVQNEKQALKSPYLRDYLERRGYKGNKVQFDVFSWFIYGNRDKNSNDFLNNFWVLLEV